MKGILRSTPVALAIVIGLVGPLSSSGAQSGGTLSIVPESAAVDMGAASFTASVFVSGVTNETGLGGYDLYVKYNPAVIQVVSAVDSGFITNTENIVVCVDAYIDNANGEIILSCVTVPVFVGNGPIVADQQLLATVTFKPVSAGSSPLEITDSSLTDPFGADLDVTLQSSQVTVQVQQQEATAEPTEEGTTPVATPATPDVPPVATIAAATATPFPTATATVAVAGNSRLTPSVLAQTGEGEEAGGGPLGGAQIVLLLVGVLLIGSAIGGGVLFWQKRRGASTS